MPRTAPYSICATRSFKDLRRSPQPKENVEVIDCSYYPAGLSNHYDLALFANRTKGCGIVIEHSRAYPDYWIVQMTNESQALYRLDEFGPQTQLVESGAQRRARFAEEDRKRLNALANPRQLTSASD